MDAHAHSQGPDSCMVVCLATLLAVVLVLICCWAQMKTTKAGFGAVTHNQAVLAHLVRPGLSAAQAGLHSFGASGVEEDNQFKRTNPIGKVLPGSLAPSSMNPLVVARDPSRNVHFSGELPGSMATEDARIFDDKASAARMVLSGPSTAAVTGRPSPEDLAKNVRNIFGTA